MGHNSGATHTNPVVVGASSLAVILGINTYLKFSGGGGTGEYIPTCAYLLVIRDACSVII